MLIKTRTGNHDKALYSINKKAISVSMVEILIQYGGAEGEIARVEMTITFASVPGTVYIE